MGDGGGADRVRCYCRLHSHFADDALLLDIHDPRKGNRVLCEQRLALKAAGTPKCEGGFRVRGQSLLPALPKHGKEECQYDALAYTLVMLS